RNRLKGDKPAPTGMDPQLATAAVRLKSPRPARRPVRDHNGVVHPSCFAASLAHGLNPASGYLRARAQRQGWAFPDELLEQARPAPSPTREG
ncbi:MAG TPA: hypothetical protein VFY87_27295, partial [Geminicoccaceae bacterium]|nr:hypothetical protein [Geminicoccaceae bacterium]